MGGCRNDDDAARLKELQAYAEQLGLGEDVEWWVGPWELRYGWRMHVPSCGGWGWARAWSGG